MNELDDLLDMIIATGRQHMTTVMRHHLDQLDAALYEDFVKHGIATEAEIRLFALGICAAAQFPSFIGAFAYLAACRARGVNP